MPSYFAVNLFSKMNSSNVSTTTDPILQLERYIHNKTGHYMDDSKKVYTGLLDSWFDAALINVQSMRGMHVFIQNSTDYPFNLTPSPTLLNPGFGVEISVDRSFYSQFNKWPYAYSECRVNQHNELIGAPLDDTYLFEQVVATSYTYTRTTCIFFCAQVLTTELCGCNNYDLAMRVPGFDLCVSVNQSVCANNFFYLTFKAGDFIRDNCLHKCPLEYHQSTLATSFKYFKFPNANDLAAIRSNQSLASKFANETDFGSNLPINAVKFLHLFLGMRLLSFIELLELVYIFVSSSKKDTNSIQIVINRRRVRERDPNKLSKLPRTRTPLRRPLRSKRYLWKKRRRRSIALPKLFTSFT